ncbi:DUF4114 domain-containing protein [Aquimarina algicola]|uniref:DUF4114 domain-containing protein n=1 Tax=Aquimarina algicola TaxID=2589995 RepID=A0A504JGJ4_9FLAO|nr:DUF4114 domain-containing protein [Aquimarina algicola]TPN86888.1 DUF4114 domain-containing protein [Aquimarina algicola]
MKKILLLTSICITTLLSAQNYQYLGDFDSNGVPLYLDESDIVSQETLDMIAGALPESYPVPEYNPHYISSGYDTDIVLTETADIWVTFVGEGAGYKNVLGFYTYDVDNPSASAPTAEDITIIFPNVSAKGSGGGLEVGNKVKIGTFSPGTGIGWVLLANAWSNGSVGSGLWQLHSNPDYNPESDPELRYHNVLLSDPENERIILGFEDIRRDYASCDQDFNDALFYITANPYTAIKTDNYADVDSATDVTSANDGGLESNGDLANLIAKRNFARTKTNSIFNTKKSQKKFKPNAKSNTSGEHLGSYFPETGMFGTESAYISSPEDLVGITNAKKVFSVDYYQGAKRIAAGFATATQGSVYDHSKTICDRLNGSKLLDVRTVKIRKHTIVSSKIERATGEVEYALTFSIKKGSKTNELYSLWNIGNYPTGDYTNFQIWGGSVSQVATIANNIIDVISQNKALKSYEIDDRTPTVFVQKGAYSQGKITLDIVNKFGAKQMMFDGNVRRTEQSIEQNINKVVTLSGTYKEQVTIETDYLFDIGFSIIGENSAQVDGLYLADGPWGIDYLDQGVTVENFEVGKHNIQHSEDTYLIERDATVQGQVKETLNLFRNILAGELTLEVTDYEAVQFKMQNNMDVEVILVTEGLTNWNNRLRYNIKASDKEQLYNIPFSHFVNGSEENEDFKKIRSIVFSVQGDYQNFVPFHLQVSELSFEGAKSEENTDFASEATQENEELAQVLIEEDSKDTILKNYPNPFINQTTIQIPGDYDQIDLKVIDMLGRTVRQENVTPNNNTIIFKTKNLVPGIYYYIIRGNNKKKYKGSFMVI